MDDEDTTHAWPDVPRICFGAGEPAQLNACVGWVLGRPHDMLGYVEGYRRAAAAVFAQAVERSASPDFLVFPMTYLWRHHVELALKDIIAVGRQIAREEWGFPNGHGLLPLWTEAKRHFVDDPADPGPEVAIVEANIRELQRFDPTAEGFRYPVNRDRTASGLAETPEYVNLRVLHEAMEAVANFLEAVRCELGVRLEHVVDRERERGTY